MNFDILCPYASCEMTVGVSHGRAYLLEGSSSFSRNGEVTPCVGMLSPSIYMISLVIGLLCEDPVRGSGITMLGIIIPSKEKYVTTVSLLFTLKPSSSFNSLLPLSSHRSWEQRFNIYCLFRTKSDYE